MYLFRIKADAADIDVPTVRSLLSFAILMLMLYRNENIFSINIAVAVIILIADLFAETLLVKFKINLLWIVGAAAILFVIATKALPFAALIMIIALVVKYSYIEPTVEITEKGVQVKKTYNNKKHSWNSFNNLVLKDNLLTLDFKNNKVLQLEVEEKENFDEKRFNEFCGTRIHE
ncbi:MAG: hypothetical protein V4685_13545 [Bacteroidota bacterium]